MATETKKNADWTIDLETGMSSVVMPDQSKGSWNIKKLLGKVVCPHCEGSFWLWEVLSKINKLIFDYGWKQKASDKSAADSSERILMAGVIYDQLTDGTWSKKMTPAERKAAMEARKAALAEAAKIRESLIQATDEDLKKLSGLNMGTLSEMAAEILEDRSE